MRRFLLPFALAVCVLRPAASHAGTADPSGLSNLLWPLVIIASPYLLIRGEVSGDAADRRAMEQRRKEADILYRTQRPPVAAEGVYIGKLPLKDALRGIMAFRRVPIVELDSAGARWLLEQAADPKPLVAQAVQHPYIRLGIGERGSATCLAFPERNDWTRSIPFTPGRCLSISFEDTLVSDVELKLVDSRRSERTLEWQLRRRANEEVLERMPFWTPQRHGAAVAFRAEYDGNSRPNESEFKAVVTLLNPLREQVDVSGRPVILRWSNGMEFARSIGSSVLLKWSVPLSPVPADWTYPRKELLLWEDAVVRAYRGGQPLLVNERFVILPDEDRVVFPRWPEWSNKAIDGKLIYTATTIGLSAKVASFWADGRPRWLIEVEPQSLPPEVVCPGPYSCKVSVAELRAGTSELILVVRIEHENGRSTAWHEMRVPIHTLPQ